MHWQNFGKKWKLSCFFLLLNTLLFSCQAQKDSQTAPILQTIRTPVTALSPSPSKAVLINTPTDESAIVTQEPYPLIEVLPEAETDTPTPTFNAQALGEVQVKIDLKRTLYKVGDVIIVNVVVSNLPRPNYEVILRDEGVQTDTPVAQISATNQVSILENDSKILKLQSVSAANQQLILQFRAKSAGKTTLTVNVFSENSSATSSMPFFQMGSDEILIVIEK